MCRAGPRPFFGCMSHSFAGPPTSPPQLTHFTEWPIGLLGEPTESFCRSVPDPEKVVCVAEAGYAVILWFGSCFVAT